MAKKQADLEYTSREEIDAEIERLRKLKREIPDVSLAAREKADSLLKEIKGFEAKDQAFIVKFLNDNREKLRRGRSSS